MQASVRSGFRLKCHHRMVWQQGCLHRVCQGRPRQRRNVRIHHRCHSNPVSAVVGVARHKLESGHLRVALDGELAYRSAGLALFGYGPWVLPMLAHGVLQLDSLPLRPSSLTQ